MWVVIEEFPNYKINKKGEILGPSGKILKPYIRDRGYAAVGLYKNNKSHLRTIHRLVAITFIPNPNKYPQVNHKDSNPSNNKVNNLEWCTHQMNIDHYIENGRSNPPTGERAHSSKLVKRDIGKIRKMLAKGFTQNQIAKIFGVYQSTISDIASGVTWKEI